MRLPTPTVRLAIVGLLVLTVAMAAVTGLHLRMLAEGQALNELSAVTVGKAVFPGAVTWFLLALGFLAGVWYAGPRVAHRMGTLGKKLAGGRRDPEGAIDRAQEEVGPVANSMRPLASAVKAFSEQRVEAHGQVGALLQINPHYVLLCTLEGDLVEANPAFYAITGFSPEAIQGETVALLQESFPIEPLLGLVRRSAREESSISGIEYVLTDRNGVPRPVEVSLRAIKMDGKKGAIIQATDVSKERKLKRRVEDFSDTLDLMVDQRVAAQLTAGRSELEGVLEAMGVAVLSFDAAGGVRRFSPAAGRLLGKDPSVVSHFSTFLKCLGLLDSDRAAFTRWFWGTTDAPLAAHVVKAVPGEAASVQRVVWYRAQGNEPGSSDHRVLLGVPVPQKVTDFVHGDGQRSDQRSEVTMGAYGEGGHSM